MTPSQAPAVRAVLQGTTADESAHADLVWDDRGQTPRFLFLVPWSEMRNWGVRPLPIFSAREGQSVLTYGPAFAVVADPDRGEPLRPVVVADRGPGATGPLPEEPGETHGPDSVGAASPDSLPRRPPASGGRQVFDCAGSICAPTVTGSIRTTACLEGAAAELIRFRPADLFSQLFFHIHTDRCLPP